MPGESDGGTLFGQKYRIVSDEEMERIVEEGVGEEPFRMIAASTEYAIDLDLDKLDKGDPS
ncbi:hypothetical protein AB0A05_27100 [Streptomyces sp. NPDC046374]|uniref:hypothetical protein n=1 Tax=Streptomyces sp. NPDC046374 TaxID=3154917 RepID=UPI003401A446